MEVWIKPLLDSSVAIGVLIAVLIGLYRIIAWLGVHVILPAIQAHIAFLGTASQAIQAQTLLLKSMEANLTHLSGLLEQHRAWMGQHDGSQNFGAKDGPVQTA